jgi:hypothetical protein
MLAEKLNCILKKTLNTGLGVKVRSFFADDYFKNRIVHWLLALIIIANLINWAVFRIFIKPVDFPIILHYNVYFGVDMLGDWKWVFFLPIVGLFLFFTNVFLSIIFYRKKERIASYLLLIASLMIQLNLIIASSSVIIINY